MRKTLLFAGIFVLGLVIGAGAILLYFGRSSNARGWFGEVWASSMAGQYAYTQYREAEYQSAVSALQAYLDYLSLLAPAQDAWATGQSPWLDARGLAFTKALTCARLAILHERSGNQAASETTWVQAQRFAIQAHWRETSKEHIRAVVLRLDR